MGGVESTSVVPVESRGKGHPARGVKTSQTERRTTNPGRLPAPKQTEKQQTNSKPAPTKHERKILTSPTMQARKGNEEGRSKNEPIYFPLPSPLVLRKKREASMNGKTMEDFFEGMPVEMLFYILQFLEIYELARLAFVCKYFKEVLEQPESDFLWKNLHDKSFGGGGRKTLYYRVDLRKGSGRPWEDDSHALYWRKVCIDETRQMLWRSKNRSEKLRWSAEKGHWRILKTTLREVPVDCSEINRLMVISAGEGHFKSVDLLANILLASGVGLDGVGLSPKNNYSALLKAALWGNAEVVKLLLNKGADVNIRDKWNDTACIKAGRAGHKEVVRVLTLHKLCNLTLVNLDGDDALLASAKAGHMDVVQVLLNAGAVVDKVHKDDLQFWYQIMGLK